MLESVTASSCDDEISTLMSGHPMYCVSSTFQNKPYFPYRICYLICHHSPSFALNLVYFTSSIASSPNHINNCVFFVESVERPTDSRKSSARKNFAEHFNIFFHSEKNFPTFFAESRCLGVNVSEIADTKKSR